MRLLRCRIVQRDPELPRGRCAGTGPAFGVVLAVDLLLGCRGAGLDQQNVLWGVSAASPGFPTHWGSQCRCDVVPLDLSGAEGMLVALREGGLCSISMQIPWEEQGTDVVAQA